MQYLTQASHVPGIVCYRHLILTDVSGIIVVVVQSLSCVRLFVTPWTIAHQAPPSMGSSRQEYWSGLPFPSPGDLPDPGIEPRSPIMQADALTSEPPGKQRPKCKAKYYKTPRQKQRQTTL